MTVDIEALLVEVSPEAPCGEDLSYDPSFLALEDMLRAKPAGGVVEGVEEAVEEPNWREVRDKSLELLGRSKDLRIALYLTLALLKIENLEGLSDGLHIIKGMLERYWTRLYPQLDPGDNDDPLERMNVLQALSPATVSEQDPMKFKQRLADVLLCNSARMGRFSLRDIQVARGEITVAAETAASLPGMDVIDAAFLDTATEELQATAQAVSEAIEHAKAIAALFAQQASGGQAPDLSGFETVLEQVQRSVQGYLAQRGYGQGAPDEAAQATDEAQEGGPSPSGAIRSAEDARLAMEKICQYFERHEPSSPVPLLLRRAQRLVSKNFLDVVQDVCPEALSQIQMLGGITDSDSG